MIFSELEKRPLFISNSLLEALLHQFMKYRTNFHLKVDYESRHHLY